MSSSYRPALGLCIWLACCQSLHAASLSATKRQQKMFADTIKQILISKMPRQHSEEDGWGKTVRIFSGVKFKGLKISARKKEVPHGQWKRFKIWIDNPKRDVRLAVGNYRKVATNKTQFDLDGSVDLHVHGEFRQYTNGLKLIGVGAEADVRLRIFMTCELTVRVEGKGFKTELVIIPRIVHSDLSLYEFDLKRVGFIKGGAAQDLGDEMKHRVRKMLDRHDGRVRTEANIAIVKSLDKHGVIRVSILKMFQPLLESAKSNS